MTDLRGHRDNYILGIQRDTESFIGYITEVRLDL